MVYGVMYLNMERGGLRPSALLQLYLSFMEMTHGGLDDQRLSKVSNN